MAVVIDQQTESAIREEGRTSYPHECCGFLVGRLEQGARRIARMVPVANAREDEAKHNRYLITPELFMKTERQAREKGLDVLGFYHSHPDAPARPSTFDTDHAWPWYAYIIVSIQQGKAEKMTAWVLQDDRARFNEIPITIED